MRDIGKTRKANARLPTIDGSHNEADLCRVSCACEVSIDLLGLVLIQVNEAVEYIVTSGCIVFTTLIVREVVLHRADWKFLFEPINLVEEQDDGRLNKPPRVADRVEQGQCFLHAIDCLIFEKELVVLGDGHKK